MLKIKTILVIVLIGVMSFPVFAKQSHKGWLTDYKKAMKIASKKELPILVDFSGSDWCGWCVRLNKEVFSQAAFLEYAKDNFVLLSLDYPKRTRISSKLKQQNAELAKKYKIKGFPTVLILDKKGNVLKKLGYKPGGAKNYIKILKNAKSIIEKKK